jgi:hypothetical protein
MVRIVEKRNACRDLVGNPEGKGHLGKRRCKWDISIRMELKKFDERMWTGLFWHRIRTNGGLL